jgi:hypothetical protein
MFLITQPALFSVAWWVIFVVIAYCVARYARWWCIPIGYLAVAVIMYQVDVAWVRYEMSRPGWDDAPDIDVLFAIGLFMRMGFMCAALLPITALGVWLRRRRGRPTNRRSHLSESGTSEKFPSRAATIKITGNQ